jgi:protoporphyrin/coproporphyrin ferrochelatase
MKHTKEAVLLVNLGTPDNPGAGAVGRYLSQFLNDKRVIDINPIARFILVNLIIIPFRRFRSSALYKQIWSKDGSPLLLHGIALKEKLQIEMGNAYTVELAMRYQKPSIRKALENLRKHQPSKIHVLPLYPQYASSSTGSTIEDVLNKIKGWEVIPSLNIISKFYDHPAFLKALLSEAKNYKIEAYDHVLFSYHGLPERQIRKGAKHYGADSCNFGNCCNSITPNNHFCYRANCMETSRQLVKALNIPEGKYSSAFQSRLDNKWLKPYSDKVVEELAKSGKKKVLVFSPAFVADCLETIHEIGHEYLEIFQHHGGSELTLVKSLNASDEWVKAVKEIVLN